MDCVFARVLAGADAGAVGDSARRARLPHGGERSHDVWRPGSGRGPGGHGECPGTESAVPPHVPRAPFVGSEYDSPGPILHVDVDSRSLDVTTTCLTGPIRLASPTREFGNKILSSPLAFNTTTSLRVHSRII
eukprot:2690505-Pyramimonas_sp.AAC.1